MRTNDSPIDIPPWFQFTDYYFAGTPARHRVADDWQAFESKCESVLEMEDEITGKPHVSYATTAKTVT
jgi:hypothetical protein